MVHSRKKVSISIQIDIIPLRIILILRFSGVKIFIGNTWIWTCNLKLRASLMLYHYARRKLLRTYILWKTKNAAFPILLCISFLWRYIAFWNVDIGPKAHVSHASAVMIWDLKHGLVDNIESWRKWDDLRIYLLGPVIKM